MWNEYVVTGSIQAFIRGPLDDKLWFIESNSYGLCIALEFNTCSIVF